MVATPDDLFSVPGDRFPKPSLRIYDKDLTEHALQHLPHISEFTSKEQIRQFMAEKIRFNSLATRRRAANYLINRFFPGNSVNLDLPGFAAATAGKASLGEALFYLTCRSELIVALVAEYVVFPSLAQGGVARNRILEFVQSKFSNSKSAPEISQAIVRTYERFGIGTANRGSLKVSLREGSIEAFAYVLHLEFPEPGMYPFESILGGPMHKWLLWDRDWMMRQLYYLREGGLLVKVSEIDRMRQFTTKFGLADAIEPIVALTKESVP
jgi:DNA repair protein RadC